MNEIYFRQNRQEGRLGGAKAQKRKSSRKKIFIIYTLKSLTSQSQSLNLALTSSPL